MPDPAIFPPPPQAQQQRQQQQRTRPDKGRVVIPLAVGGMYSAGDPASIPDGHTVSLSNMLVRPNRVDSRPPAVYDNLMAVMGLHVWEDLANQNTRFIALDASKLYIKSASTETWDAGTSGITGTRPTDYCNYRGKLYIMLDDGAGSPTTAISYDGTNISTTPFNSTLESRAIAVFNDRLYFAYPRVTVTPQYTGSTTAAAASYGFDGVKWNKTNVTVKALTQGSTTTYRAYPTSTTNSYLNYGFTSAGIRYGLYAVSNTAPQAIVYRQDMRCLDPTYNMPVTINLLLITNWLAATAYAVGDVVNGGASDIGGTIQRCTTAGTSGGSAPAWATTVGATTVDNTVTWTCEQANNIIGSITDTIPNATTAPGWTTFYCPAVLPITNNTSTGQQTVGVQIAFFNTTTPTIQLAPVDLAFKDGLANGDVRKQNHGSQLTVGSFRNPFWNADGAATSNTVNLETLVWSEIADASTIRNANNFEPKDVAGLPTALGVVGGRLILFKRRAFWQFAPQDDPDNPIVPEGPVRTGVGCLGPRAWDTLDDEIFWIAENEVYRMKIGYPPRPLCDQAMREEIMNHAAAGWVESQSTYNMPLLAIDRKNREVWVYTQKGLLYCYHMGDEAVPGVFRPYTPERGLWSKHDIQSAEVRAMAWNAVTQELYISLGGFGLVRLDATQTAQDIIDNTATGHDVLKNIVFRPIDSQLGDQRFDSIIEGIGVYHLATASQTGSSVFAYMSLDKGTSFPKFNQIRFDPTVARILIPLFQSGPSITVKLAHNGKAGPAVWSLSSECEAMLLVKRGEYPQSKPTQLGSSL